MEAEGREEQTPVNSGHDAVPVGARHRKAALGWILLLVLIAGLAALCWPRLEPLMRRGADPVAPPGAGAAPTGLVPPKRSNYDYPPCTATRTDSCVQKDNK
ncbi:MAG: hypothetical protein JWO25_2874 [Alphaproteobacteria bacterium]|nr:hypothetical protein [Alphaproteobacteria bacterium]